MLSSEARCGGWGRLGSQGHAPVTCLPTASRGLTAPAPSVTSQQEDPRTVCVHTRRCRECRGRVQRMTVPPEESWPLSRTEQRARETSVCF